MWTTQITKRTLFKNCDDIGLMKPCQPNLRFETVFWSAIFRHSLCSRQILPSSQRIVGFTFLKWGTPYSKKMESWDKTNRFQKSDTCTAVAKDALLCTLTSHETSYNAPGPLRRVSWRGIEIGLRQFWNWFLKEPNKHTLNLRVELRLFLRATTVSGRAFSRLTLGDRGRG